MSRKKHFEHLIRVYYEDTDFSGIVYHGAHVKFFERGRTEALRSCGVSHTDLLARAEPLAFSIRKMTTEWIRPAKIDDLLNVHTTFVEARGARMTLRQQIWRADQLIAEASVEAACIAISGRPRRLPEDIIAKITP